MNMPQRLRLLPFLLVLGTLCLPAQSPLLILKVDPPNWYATLPKPMLLVRGEGFTGATFTLDDPSLRIDRTVLSANGHWAQLWLSASPTNPETIQLRVARGTQHAEQPYTFAAPRPPGDGAAGFSTDDVMYLIMTDRFADGDLTNDGPLGHSLASSAEAVQERAKPKGWHGGDLRGIEQHLEYLQQLGVTTIWPTPVYRTTDLLGYHGYHTSDYYDVDPHYGSLEDLRLLGKALHSRGMKLVLDTVPNHVGPFHPWIDDEPAPDWFHGTKARHVATQYDFNYLIDPHSTERDRTPIIDGWFIDRLPDMNTESPAVAQYLRQNAVWWIEQTGADGLRIDTFAYVNRQFWRDYDQTLSAIFPHLTEVGEVLVDDPKIASFFAGGRANTAADGTVDTGLYTPFDFPSFFTLTAALTGKKPMAAIPDVLRSDSLYPHADRLVTLIGNHDTPRFLSLPGANPARLRMAFGLLATMRGMPHLYYGDEIAMSGGEDPDNRKDMPGGFPGDASSGFTKSARTGDEEAMHAWVQAVMQLRLRSRALREGYEQNLFGDATAFAFLRGDRVTAGETIGDCLAAPSAERYLVVLNVDTKPRDIAVDTRSTGINGCTVYEPLLETGAKATGTPQGVNVHLAGESIGIFKAQP